MPPKPKPLDTNAANKASAQDVQSGRRGTPRSLGEAADPQFAQGVGLPTRKKRQNAAEVQDEEQVEEVDKDSDSVMTSRRVLAATGVPKTPSKTVNFAPELQGPTALYPSLPANDAVPQPTYRALSSREDFDARHDAENERPGKRPNNRQLSSREDDMDAEHDTLFVDEQELQNLQATIADTFDRLVAERNNNEFKGLMRAYDLARKAAGLAKIPLKDSLEMDKAFMSIVQGHESFDNRRELTLLLRKYDIPVPEAVIARADGNPAPITQQQHGRQPLQETTAYQTSGARTSPGDGQLTTQVPGRKGRIMNSANGTVSFEGKNLKIAFTYKSGLRTMVMLERHVSTDTFTKSFLLLSKGQCPDPSSVELFMKDPKNIEKQLVHEGKFAGTESDLREILKLDAKDRPLGDTAYAPVESGRWQKKNPVQFLQIGRPTKNGEVEWKWFSYSTIAACLSKVSAQAWIDDTLKHAGDKSLDQRRQTEQKSKKKKSAKQKEQEDSEGRKEQKPKLHKGTYVREDTDEEDEDDDEDVD